MAILPGPPTTRLRRSSVSSLAEKGKVGRRFVRPRRLIIILLAVSVLALYHLFTQAISREQAQLRLALEKQRARLPKLMGSPLPPGVIFTTPSSDQNLVPDLPFTRLGSKLSDLVAPGWDKKNTNAAGTFNPALLRLPKGLDWQYLVVARAPGVYHKERWVAKANSYWFEQGLVGFGVNRTEDGRFVAVSYETKLAIDAPAHAKCGNWAHYSGAEDPRLSWSDDLRPVISFGLPAGDLLPHACRSLAFSRDLRTLWPELDEVLKDAPGIAPTLIGSSRASIFEVTTKRAQWIEKNWQMLWPGARPSRTPGVVPSFSYAPAPSIIIEPSRNTTGEAIVRDRQKEQEVRHYDEIIPGPHASCLLRFHHAIEPKGIHHATPLYRLTLCDRGQCEPDVTNTVFITLLHLKKAPFSSKQNYGRFFTLQNVTSPYDYVAVGPEFHFDGTDDSKIIYGLSITFAPPPPNAPVVEAATTKSKAAPTMGRFLPPSLKALRPGPPVIDVEKQEAELGLSHGFLSDEAWISLGVADVGMSMIRLSPEEMLRGMRRCDGPAGGVVDEPDAPNEGEAGGGPQQIAPDSKADITIDMDKEEKMAMAVAQAQAQAGGRKAAPGFVPPAIKASDTKP